MHNLAVANFYKSGRINISELRNKLLEIKAKVMKFDEWGAVLPSIHLTFTHTLSLFLHTRTCTHLFQTVLISIICLSSFFLFAPLSVIALIPVAARYHCRCRTVPAQETGRTRSLRGTAVPWRTTWPVYMWRCVCVHIPSEYVPRSIVKSLFARRMLHRETHTRTNCSMYSYIYSCIRSK